LDHTFFGSSLGLEVANGRRKHCSASHQISPIRHVLHHTSSCLFVPDSLPGQNMLKLKTHEFAMVNATTLPGSRSSKKPTEYR
jgi:hypothetical protein